MQKPSIVSLCVVLFLVAGCGGGVTNSPAPLPPPPPAPAFTSSPVTAAEEGIAYSYTVAATTADGTTVSFALSAGPDGATLSGTTLTWTPTAAQSRLANDFTVTATTSAGARASQTWSVTPNGTVNISVVYTNWTAKGPFTKGMIWPAGAPFPAVLVPQADGSFQTLNGAAAADGSFAIPNVPGGYYWLELGPGTAYWTSSSTFDAGTDIVGVRSAATLTSTVTTFTVNLSGLDPLATGDYIGATSDLFGVGLEAGAGPPVEPAGSTTATGSVFFRGNMDFSQVETLFVAQYEPTPVGSLNALVMGPELTVPNPGFTNGGTDTITATLNASPKASVDVNIKGSAWAANFQNVAPSEATPSSSAFYLSAQPFVTDRNAQPLGGILGPDVPLVMSSAGNGLPTGLGGQCLSSVGYR